jgi:hypothetical protein
VNVITGAKDDSEVVTPTAESELKKVQRWGYPRGPRPVSVMTPTASELSQNLKRYNGGGIHGVSGLGRCPIMKTTKFVLDQYAS